MLFRSSKHLAILDEYMGREALEYRNHVKEVYERYRKALAYAETFQMEEEQRMRELSFLEFECQEIEEANLKEEEEEELSAWYKKAIHGKKIMETIARIYDEINYDGMDSAGEKIGHAVHEIATVVEYDETLRSLSEQLMEIDNLLSDFLREVSSDRKSTRLNSSH